MMTKRQFHERRIAPYLKQYERVKERIAKLDEKAVKRAESGEPLCAYVTFQRQEAKVKCLTEYDVFWACGRQPSKLKYKGESIMNVRQAPAPSTLLWENQEVPFRARLWRRLLVLFVLVIILGITASISFICDSYRVFDDVVEVASGYSLSQCVSSSFSSSSRCFD